VHAHVITIWLYPTIRSPTTRALLLNFIIAPLHITSCLNNKKRAEWRITATIAKLPPSVMNQIKRKLQSRGPRARRAPVFPSLYYMTVIYDGEPDRTLMSDQENAGNRARNDGQRDEMDIVLTPVKFSETTQQCEYQLPVTRATQKLLLL